MPFVNIGEPVSTTAAPVPLLGDVVFVYLAAKAASVGASFLAPAVRGKAATPTVVGDSIYPTIQAGAET
jgi:hypothetical protein